MSKTIEALRRQIGGAKDLQSVVHTMKMIAASHVTQFERAATGSADYFGILELGLVAYFHSQPSTSTELGQDTESSAPTGVIVFGSDQGLVGRFNESLAESVRAWIAAEAGDRKIFAIGERLASALVGVGAPPVTTCATANSLDAISHVVARVLVDVGQARERGEIGSVWVFHNRPLEGDGFEPTQRRILPLDRAWQQGIEHRKWPTKVIPEVLGGSATLPSLISEYLYVSLFQACAESLASENAGRLIAMQRAEKNIEGLLGDETQEYNRLRQSTIDEELFEVVAGFEAISASTNIRPIGPIRLI